MGFIISFVVRAFNRESNLVSDTYYEEGLEYENKVESQNNYVYLESKIHVNQMPEGIVISFPEEIENPQNGIIKFYRPQSKRYDRKFDLELDQNKNQTLEYENFVEGFYQISILWEEGEKSYLFEEDITF